MPEFMFIPSRELEFINVEACNRDYGHDVIMVDVAMRHTWHAMLYRCFKEDCKAWKWYGGRGITVCERWLKFENFFADMGHRPPGTTLDRIDNDGNYEPGNCRWATPKQQARNTSKTHRLKIYGQTKSLLDWAELKGISPDVIRRRLKAGWSPRAAVMTPAGEKVPRPFRIRKPVSTPAAIDVSVAQDPPVELL